MLRSINGAALLFRQEQDGSFVPSQDKQSAVAFNTNSVLKLSGRQNNAEFSTQEKELATKLGFDALASINQYGDIERIEPIKAGVLINAETELTNNARHFNVPNCFHGTNQFFNTFTETADVGFHFGNKSAALARMRTVGAPKVDVIKIEHASDNAFQQYIDNLDSDNKLERSYAVLMTRLSSPKPNLRASLESMSEDELEDIAQEYEAKPLSSACAIAMETSGKPTEFIVRVDGEELASFDTITLAKAAKEIAQKSMLKQVSLSLKNPIRLPDLGLWSAYDIATHAGFESERLSLVMQEQSGDKQYSKVIDLLEQDGFDGIVYKNEVEKAGSDSFIVFNKNQIMLNNSFKIALNKEYNHALG